MTPWQKSCGPCAQRKVSDLIDEEDYMPMSRMECISFLLDSRLLNAIA